MQQKDGAKDVDREEAQLEGIFMSSCKDHYTN